MRPIRESVTLQANNGVSRVTEWALTPETADEYSLYRFIDNQKPVFLKLAQGFVRQTPDSAPGKRCGTVLYFVG